jgi:hypothetical protein
VYDAEVQALAEEVTRNKLIKKKMDDSNDMPRLRAVFGKCSSQQKRQQLAQRLASQLREVETADLTSKCHTITSTNTTQHAVTYSVMRRQCVGQV